MENGNLEQPLASRLRKPGDWQGTAMIPVSGVSAIFAFERGDGGAPEVWAEPVLAWVMAERRYGEDESRTTFFGLALLTTANPGLYAPPEACETIHGTRGCHIGYTRGSMADSNSHSWDDVAADHLRRCRRRRSALETP